MFRRTISSLSISSVISNSLTSHQESSLIQMLFFVLSFKKGSSITPLSISGCNVAGYSHRNISRFGRIGVHGEGGIYRKFRIGFFQIQFPLLLGHIFFGQITGYCRLWSMALRWASTSAQRSAVTSINSPRSFHSPARESLLIFSTTPLVYSAEIFGIY